MTVRQTSDAECSKLKTLPATAPLAGFVIGALLFVAGFALTFLWPVAGVVLMGLGLVTEYTLYMIAWWGRPQKRESPDPSATKNRG